MNSPRKKRLLWNVGKLLVIIGLISLALGLPLSTWVTPCSTINENACVNANNIRQLVGFALIIVGFEFIITGAGAIIASRMLD